MTTHVTITGADGTKYGPVLNPYKVTDIPDPVPPTLFGAFPGYQSATDHSESYASRLARVTVQFGKLAVERKFMETNFTLPATNNPTIASWNFPVATTVAGQFNSQIDTIAKSATKPLWFVPWHEVDNNKLTPADYVRLFRYITGRVRAVGNPLVHMTPIFMGYTVKNMDLTKFNQFYPGDDVVDAIGFDTYVNPGIPALSTPEGCESAPLKIAAAHNKPLVIGEVSLYKGYTDAQWTDFTARLIELLDKPNVQAVAWFETNKADGDWRLSNHPAALSEYKAVTSR